jgi:hypothetical protein
MAILYYTAGKFFTRKITTAEGKFCTLEFITLAHTIASGPLGSL